MRIPPSVAGSAGPSAGPASGVAAARLRAFQGNAVFGATDGDPRPLLFDRDLRDPRVLHDPHDLADALGPGLVDSAAEQGVLAARPVSDRS